MQSPAAVEDRRASTRFAAWCMVMLALSGALWAAAALLIVAAIEVAS